MCAAMVSANMYKGQRGSHRKGVCTCKWWPVVKDELPLNDFHTYTSSCSKGWVSLPATENSTFLLDGHKS